MKFIKVFAGNGCSFGLTENALYRWGSMFGDYISPIPMKIDNVRATDIIHFGFRHFNNIALLLSDGRVKLHIADENIIFKEDRALKIFDADPEHGVYVVCESKIYLFNISECSKINSHSLKVENIVSNVILTEDGDIYEFNDLDTPVAKEVKSMKRVRRAVFCLLEDGRILYRNRGIWKYKYNKYVELLNFYPLAAVANNGEIHVFDQIEGESPSHKITGELFSRIISSESMIVLIDDLNITVHSRKKDPICKRMHRAKSRIVDGSVRDHILLIDEDGRVVCHGDNSSGQLGIGTTEKVAKQRYVERRDCFGKTHIMLDDRVTDLLQVSMSQDEYEEMEKRVKDLETHIECMPDGKVFLETLEHFNSLKGGGSGGGRGREK